jgi:hypothetical protein
MIIVRGFVNITRKLYQTGPKGLASYANSAEVLLTKQKIFYRGIQKKEAMKLKRKLLRKKLALRRKKTARKTGETQKLAGAKSPKRKRTKPAGAEISLSLPSRQVQEQLLVRIKEEPNSFRFQYQQQQQQQQPQLSQQQRERVVYIDADDRAVASTRCQSYKTFFVSNLRIYIIKLECLLDLAGKVSQGQTL